MGHLGVIGEKITGPPVSMCGNGTAFFLMRQVVADLLLQIIHIVKVDKIDIRSEIFAQFRLIVGEKKTAAA